MKLEKTGDPTHLIPMEIALSRCSWAPSETSSEANDPADPQAARQIDACLTNAIGKLSKQLRSMPCETRDALSKLLEIHLAPESLASLGIATALLESDDCTIEFVDLMPSAEGLLMCVLLRQKEPSSGGVDGLPLNLVQ